MQTPVNHEELSMAVRKLDQQEASLREIARMAQHDLARIAVEMTEVERLINRKDAMQSALSALQIKAQEKNKGVFEGLLTNLIQEVLPGKNDQVVLTSALKNNRASLDFNILCDGNLENISRDKGGSIANIVAMGLRFIVLTRHPNRRVLFLDEADCHLKGEYIPAFAAVMRQLANKMGIQVIYISHHAPSNFVGYGRVIEIHKEAGKTHARILHEESEEDRNIESMSAFRYIRLRDYGPHENLLMELSPGLNVITGDVDTGKSKITQAIADLIENGGDECRIRHGRPFFDVEVGLEEGMTLNWKYLRKGSKRTSFVLKDAQGQEIETSDLGSDVPEWLHQYLSMPMVNGDSLHIHSQKRPHYLLSDTEYTSIKRAEMLPLGRESRDVHRMIQLFTARLASARQDHARLLREMNMVKNTLAILAPVLDEPLDLDWLQKGLQDVKARHQRQQALLQVSQRLEGLASVTQSLGELFGALKQTQAIAPVLKADPDMQRSIAHLEVLVARRDIIAALGQMPSAPAAPKLHDLTDLKAYGLRIGGLVKLKELMQSLAGLEKAHEVKLRADAPMHLAIQRLEQAASKKQALGVQLKQCHETAERIASRKAALYQQLGGVCPTCQGPLENHRHD